MEPVVVLVRPRTVKFRIALSVLVLLLGACGTTALPGKGGNADEGPELMVVALVQLVTKDHTFGEGPPPFTEYLIQDRIDPSAGAPTASPDRSTRGLTEAERAAIEDAMSEYGHVRWIEDPDEWRTTDLRPIVEGAVILGVGQPIIQGDTGLVPVSLWCGGTCGTWLTYRLDLVNDSWVVTGTEGAIAIS